MVKPIVLLFAVAPILFGFALGYLIAHPDAPDRGHAAVGAVVFAVLWAVSVYVGQRWRRRAAQPMRAVLLVVLAASAALGVTVLALEVTGAAEGSTPGPGAAGDDAGGPDASGGEGGGTAASTASPASG